MSTDELQQEFEQSLKLTELKHIRELQALNEDKLQCLTSARQQHADELAEERRLWQQSSNTTSNNQIATNEAALALVGLAVAHGSCCHSSSVAVSGTTPSHRRAVSLPQNTASLAKTCATPMQKRTEQMETDANIAAAVALISTPASGLSKSYLLGTPRGGTTGVEESRPPVVWVIEQTATEVKRLRERAEHVAEQCGVGRVTMAVGNTPGGGGSGGGDAVRLKMETMRSQLAEALMVIQEQDRLIHEGTVNAIVLFGIVGLLQRFYRSLTTFWKYRWSYGH
jgi:hypothetical protein